MDKPYGIPIVIDNGSCTIKAGLATEAVPKVNMSSMTGMVENDNCLEAFGLFDPCDNGIINRGVVTNWQEMELLWSRTFRELGVKPTEHPIMLTEPPLNPKRNRRKMAEVMFETFSAPAVSFEIPGILSFYKYKKLSGFVLDCGEGVTYVIPVYEGYVMSHAIFRYNFGGQDLTKYVLKCVPKWYAESFTGRNVAKDIKEKICTLSKNKVDFYDNISNITPKIFQVSEEEALSIGEEQVKCAELLFNTMPVEQDEMLGIQNLIHKSIMKCDLDTRKSLTESIMVCGGGTLFEGFAQRLRKELVELFPKLTNFCILAPKERKLTAWKGGSIVALEPEYGKEWISRSSYYENGPSTVHYTCTRL